jgi:Zn-dependent peptidase ImmA (M78 family)
LSGNLYNLKVTWLSKKSISAKASRVIADYEAKTKRRVELPIPVESIIERGLGLRLGFLDLRRKLDMDDVLGATFVKERTICVDRSLAENQNEGRLCFTFAHETGHWVLHRELVENACRTGGGIGYNLLRGQASESASLEALEFNLSRNPRSGGFIFCRGREAKQPIEWQADYFASCLLMPEDAVRRAFCKCFGAGPLVLYNVKSAYCGPVCFDPTAETWPNIAGAIKDAGRFSNVSKQAMIIRLQDLGLVKNETRARLSWKESYAMA